MILKKYRKHIVFFVIALSVGYYAMHLQFESDPYKPRLFEFINANEDVRYKVGTIEDLILHGITVLRPSENSTGYREYSTYIKSSQGTYNAVIRLNPLEPGSETKFEIISLKKV